MCGIDQKNAEGTEEWGMGHLIWIIFDIFTFILSKELTLQVPEINLLIMGKSKLVVEETTKQRTFQFKNFGSTNFFPKLQKMYLD